MNTSSQDRVEDLEEALRLIVCLLQPPRTHLLSERDWAVLAISCDQLDLDLPLDQGAIVELFPTLGLTLP